ncbi:hypothetical protein HDU79_009258 [Rhizoclosmatium sp. JEL0117]|nr:hypothetical protein HDU79_009258 [Rhizoclosmatium sp. JEL0117]
MSAADCVSVHNLDDVHSPVPKNRNKLWIGIAAASIVIISVGVGLGVSLRNTGSSPPSPSPLSPSSNPASNPASPSPPPKLSSSNPDPHALANSVFPPTCSFYIDTLRTNINASVKSGNVLHNGFTPLAQYDCAANSFPRCSLKADGVTWDGDQDFVWNQNVFNASSSFRYNTIWFFQLIGDMDDLFHECDDYPQAFDVSKLSSTPLNLKPNCISFGKWCRTWAGTVAAGQKVDIQGTLYSVEAAFLKLSNNRTKIDFKDEPITASYLRLMPVADQQAIATQYMNTLGNGNCITDQHFCFECNGDPNNCSVADGCLRYADPKNSTWQGDGYFCP